MKRVKAYGYLIALALLVIQAQGQQKITIDKLENNMKIEKFDGDKDIHVSDIRKGDFIIAVKKDLKVTKFRQKGDDGNFFDLKISTAPPPDTQFDKYVIAKITSFKSNSLQLQLITGAGKTAKTFNAEIVFKADPNSTDGETNDDPEENRIAPCKLSELQKIHYNFIPASIFEQLRIRARPAFATPALTIGIQLFMTLLRTKRTTPQALKKVGKKAQG